MNPAMLASSVEKLARVLPGPMRSSFRWVVHRKLAGLRAGSIELEENGEVARFGDPSAPLRARVRVHDPRFHFLTAVAGTVGAGDSYIRGDWDCDRLTDLIRIGILNRDHMNRLHAGWGRLSAPFLAAYHRLRRNSRRGAARNIRDHYDLGNDFFSLFLDPTMTYSCGIFESDDASLEQASAAKYERICRKLGIGPADHLLEIGSGWGGFALHAARTRGCRVTTTTISRRQHELAAERVRAAGLAGRVEVLLEDYRELSGRYDKLVSIEMIEAIGHQFFGTFFATCARLLRPEGVGLVQAITIRDQIYDEARRSVDFIKRFVFPGSCLPSVDALSRAAARHSDLNLVHLEDITAHYPPTLRAWLANLRANRGRILSLGYTRETLRLWEFYLCYCEAGFLERNVADVQMIFARPGWRGAAPLGAVP